MMRYDSSSGSSGRDTDSISSGDSSDSDEDSNIRKVRESTQTILDSSSSSSSASGELGSVSIATSASEGSDPDDDSTSVEQESSSSDDDSNQERARPPKQSMRVKSRKKSGANKPQPQSAPSTATAADAKKVPSGYNYSKGPVTKKKKKKKPAKGKKPPKEEYMTDEDSDGDGDETNPRDGDEVVVEVPTSEEECEDESDDIDSANGDDRDTVFVRGLDDDEDAAFREIPPEAFKSPKPKTPRRRVPKPMAAPAEQAPMRPPLGTPEAVPPPKQKKPWQRGVDFFQDVPFCGRERELQTLQKAVDRISIEWMENANEVAWITGPEGVGKTALALETSDRVFDLVYCAYGSFEENTGGAKPFSGLTECLNDLVQRMQEDGGPELWKGRMEEALGGEGPFLSTVIPNLLKIMELDQKPPRQNTNGQNGHHSAPNGINATNIHSHESRRQLLLFDSNMPKRTDRLGFAIRDFLAAVSEHYPIVLVIDNLQHADLDSLRMLQSLATDKSVQNLLLIGCLGGVHGNAISSNGSVHSALSGAEKGTYIPPALLRMQETIAKEGIRSTSIELSPLTHQETEQLLSIALIEEGEDDNYDAKIEELGEILHAKCQGNPLFILHLLRVLHDKQLLDHSSQRKLWLWDCDQLEHFMDTVADTVVMLLQEKIQDMPQKMRLALTTAACAGMTNFQVDTLHHEIVAAFGGSNNRDKDIDCPIETTKELSHLLNIIASRGLLEYLSHGHYKFSHDVIRHAAFGLLPKGKKGKIIHYRIGTEVSALSVQMKDAEEKARLKFLAVDNLNRCAIGIADEKQRMKLSKLNMEAAEVAITKSAFYTSIQYLKSGISTLDPKIRWKKPLYELTLRMHLLLARTQYCCGQYPLAEATIHILLKNALCFKDKVGAYQCMILLKVEQEKYREGLDLIIFILFQLGQDIPTEDIKRHISKDIDRIRAFIREKENKDLLNPPNMTDRKCIDAMAVLAQLAEYSKYYPNKQREYRTLATLKMMKLTLRNGYCRQTSLAYSLFASTLARYGIHKEAYRLGRVAERLATNRPGCMYASQALAHYHWNVSHWGRSYIRNLAPLLKLYNDQIDAGDFRHAPISIMAYIHTHLASGCDLEQLDHNLNLFHGVFQDYELGEDWQVLIPQRMTLNLMGKRGDPDLFFGQTAEEQDSIVKEWEQEAENGTGGPASRRCQMFYFLRMFTACIFHDMVTAHHMLKQLTEKPDGVWIPYRSFLECLILLSRVKSSKDKKKKAKLQEKIDKIMYQMTGWHNDGVINCSVLVNFLEAELEVVTSKERSALKMRKFWDEAIEDAKAEGFLHLEAWANERAGLYFIEAEVPGWASTYLTRAHRSYQRWGCHAKSSLLEVQYPQYLKVGDRLNRRMSASDWRAKYDTTRKSAMEKELDDLSDDLEEETVEKPRRSKKFPVPKSPFSRSDHGSGKKKTKSVSKRRISKMFSGRKQVDDTSVAYDSTSRLGSDSEDEESPKTPRRSFLSWGKPSAKSVVDADSSDDDEPKSARSKTPKKKSKLRLSGLKKRNSKKESNKISQDSFNNDGLSD